jgi:hypothetical protein
MKKILIQVAPRYIYVLGCFILTGFCYNNGYGLFLPIIFLLSGALMLVEIWNIVMADEALQKPFTATSHHNLYEPAVSEAQFSV